MDTDYDGNGPAGLGMAGVAVVEELHRRGRIPIGMQGRRAIEHHHRALATVADALLSCTQTRQERIDPLWQLFVHDILLSAMTGRQISWRLVQADDTRGSRFKRHVFIWRSSLL